MFFSKLAMTALLAAAPIAVSATDIVISNDDGWAEANIRAVYNTLTAAGNSVVLSAPADNKSGTGSKDIPPTRRSSPCEFDSCPAGSPAYGSSKSNRRLNYVNSYPVTSMRYGIQNVSSYYFGGKPELAVAGVNVGNNLASTVLISGTVGAATEAVKEGVPAIAFSGSSGNQISYETSPMPNYVSVYARLTRVVTETLIESGKPFLPANIWLNVNFPASTSSQCTRPSDFSFVLSRFGRDPKSDALFEASTAALAALRDEFRKVAGNEGKNVEDKAEALVRKAGKKFKGFMRGQRAAHDVDEDGARDGTCSSSSSLPTESDVVDTPGCYASISVGEATTKDDADEATQQLVREKLQSILSCLPSSKSA